MDGKVTIYALCDHEGAAHYVGQTRMELGRRLLGHVNEARRGTSAKDNWFRSVLASGEKPTIRALAVTGEEGANACEQEWIARLRGQGAPILNDRSRSRAHGRRRLKPHRPERSCYAGFPGLWRDRVERLADEHGVPVAIMLRLLVHSGLEHWEARRDQRMCRTES